MDFDQEESCDTKEEIFDEPIQKNSTIDVSVDDLSEGVIVVSYVHQNKLYQGVLLQLDRERGIPSGISFPKDFCTGTACPTEEAENDPSQITPLTQRHTYFQIKDNGVADGASPGIKSRVGLRRIIKPPARFKNARMSLRLRARPVLCAKCKTLCEEIPENKDGSGKSKNKNSLKRNGSRKGQLPKNELRNGGSVSSIETSQLSAEIDNLIPVKDNQDYSYEGVGTKDIIENYWRRPLTKQIPLQLDSIQDPLKELKPGFKTTNPIVPIPLSVYSSKATDFSLRQGTSENWNSTTEPASGVDTVTTKPPPRKKRKGKSFKLCSNSEVLSEDNMDEYNPCDPNPVNIRQEEFTDLEPTGCSDLCYNEVPDNYSLPLEIVSYPNRKPVRRIKKTESRAQSRKRSSTVPVRFRDETYKLTRKNIFNFKRRQDETEEFEGVMPGFSESLLGYSPSVISSQEYCEKPDGSLLANDLSRSSTSSSSASLVHTISSSNGHPNTTDTKKESATGGKIPVIKIIFGSPGNGIVIIPPKSEYSAASDPENSEADLKAVRKALRKAKKEARRKSAKDERNTEN